MAREYMFVAFDEVIVFEPSTLFFFLKLYTCWRQYKIHPALANYWSFVDFAILECVKS